MPVFLAALVGGLLMALSSAVGRVLVALSIGYVTYTGITITLDWIQGQIVERIDGLPSTVISVLGLCQVDTCLSILMSAVAARLVLSGLTSGKLTKMVIK